MSAYDFLTQPNQYSAAQTMAVGERAEQNCLADMSREYGGAALGGDKQALNKLASLDPNMAMKVEGHQFSREEQIMDRLASAASAARTPEQYKAAIESFRQYGHEPDAFELDFNNRQAVIDRAMSVKEMLELKRQGQQDALEGEKFAWTKQYQGGMLDVAQQNAAKGEGGGEAGLNPVWGTDAKGKPVLFQLNKSGTAPQQVQFPDGITPSPGYSTVDVGTGFAPVNRRTGAVQGEIIPRDVAGEETQKIVGKGAGEARVALPDVEASADLALNTIDQIRNNPNRALGTGWSSFGNLIPGSRGYDFQQRVDQAAGGAFLQAFQTLKGGGQITEVEGQKATKAIARMQTAQSEGAFLKALDDYEAVIRAGVAKARAKTSSLGSSRGTAQGQSGYGLNALEAEMRRRGLAQ